MAKTSSSRPYFEDDPIYSRIKITNLVQNEHIDEFFEQLCTEHDAIYDVVYTEQGSTEIAAVVTGQPAEIDTTAIRENVIDDQVETDTEELGVWVRRVFPDELTELQNGETLFD